MHESKALRLWSAIVVAMTLPGVASAEWQTDPEGIMNVGEVTKSSPTGTNSNNLHYGGTGSEERADFYIDVGEATDMDCNDTDGTEEDAGLHEADTDWTCSSGAGDIADGMWSTQFVPGNTVKSSISIKAKVFEGHQYSWSDSNYDDPVEKTWDGTLSTFKIRMEAQPGGIQYAEDDSNTTRVLGQNGNAALHLGTIGWTGALSTPGNTPSPSLSGQNSTSPSWRVLAETDTGTVGGVMGTITFTPYIEGSGSLKISATDAGIQPIGSFGSVVASFAGAYNPYVGAVVGFTTWAMGSKTHMNYAVVGESTIENGVGSPPRINVVGSTNNISPFTVALSGSLLSRIYGSIPARAGVQVDDTTRLQRRRTCENHTLF